MEISTSETDDVGLTTLGPSWQSESMQSPEKAVNAAKEDSIGEENTDQPNVYTPTELKRRRVSRACDVCRRGKTKCDGKQPCTHRAMYSFDCTFDQPSKRRRHVTPQYVQSLETQLKRAKVFLSTICPTLNLENDIVESDPQGGIQCQLLVRSQHIQQILRAPSVPHGENSSYLVPPSTLGAGTAMSQHKEKAGDSHHDCHAQVRRQGVVQSETELPWGDCSPFARRRLVSPTHSTPQPDNRLIDGPAKGVQSQYVNLPRKVVAQRLCERALLGNSTLIHVVHVPTFNQSMRLVYESPTKNDGVTDEAFLPLLYAVLSVGILLSEEADFANLGYKPSTDEGFRYVRACRRVLRMADCNDLTSLQAIVFMIQFSLVFTKLSTCYSYIGVALRSALHMRLHRSSNSGFNPIDAEIRKRLFWSIRKMDTYVGTMLGLPIFLRDEDVDQDWPIEVKDEHITATNVQLPIVEETPPLAASNAHTSVIQIFAKICKHMYPVKGSQSPASSMTNTVSCLKIMELENDLERWLCDLPLALKIDGAAPSALTQCDPTSIHLADAVVNNSRQRVPALLRMTYCHAQMLLYRPFLHHLSQSRISQHINQSAIVCARACIRASREIVRIATEMKQRGLLVAADWFTTYTTFSAVVSILDFVTDNPHDLVACDSYKDAVGGKDVLMYLGKRSVAASRCANTLNTILNRSPNTVKQDTKFMNVGNGDR